MGLFKKKEPELLTAEISEKHVGLRIILFVFLLVIGLGCLTYFLLSLLNTDPGWQTIETTDKHQIISEEFVFNYNVGQGELSANDEKKQLEAIYTQAVTKAYRLFDIYNKYNDTFNLYYINTHPGETITVDPILYNAFLLLQKNGNRMVYMAPIYSEYKNLFYSQNEIEAAEFDPCINPDVEEYLKKVLTYTNDPSMIDVKLLGDNRISLFVSKEYQQFADYYGIEVYLDFSWLTNAFIVDYVSEVMIEKGFTTGNITSYDGYSRNFDASETYYSYNIFDCVDQTVFGAATMSYKNAPAIVFMRNYPMSANDNMIYFCYSDGRFAHRYADVETGLYKSALNNMVSYSYDRGCAEIALEMSEVFISDDLDENKIALMKDLDIYSVWTVDRTVNYNDESVKIGDAYVDEAISYKIHLTE